MYLPLPAWRHQWPVESFSLSLCHPPTLLKCNSLSQKMHLLKLQIIFVQIRNVCTFARECSRGRFVPEWVVESFSLSLILPPFKMYFFKLTSAFVEIAEYICKKRSKI